ncbi:MAG: RagB/SusD family nutrient uptake outer membrane protein [Bacteroides sp.]
MKRNIIVLAASVCMLSSCLNDAFMERTPLDKLTETTVFKNNDNFKSYLWKYYENGAFLQKQNYDNQATIYDMSDNSCDQGSVNATYEWGWDKGVVPTSGGGWNFSTIRGLNMMLDHIDDSGMTDGQKEHWRSVGYFFKSLEYFNLIINFGDVSWLEHYVSDADKEELYAPRMPRKEVAKKVLDMLNYAKAHISSQNDGPNTINLDCVNALISRFGLFEGTWEKYHEMSSPAEQAVYFEASMQASTELMKKYPTLMSSYDAVFNSKDLAGKPGIILYKAYLNTSGYGHTYLRYTRARALMVNATADLVQSYLCTDGKPIWTSNDYQGDKTTGNDPMSVEFMNRDRRLYYTVVPPYKLNMVDPKDITKTRPLTGRVFLKDGKVRPTDNPVDNYFVDMMGKICQEDASEKLLPILQWEGVAVSESPHIDDGRYNMGQVFCNSRGGYYTWKYYNTSTDIAGGQGDTDAALFRMGEVLINHAEAAFELGLFNQTVADATVNKLRTRAHIAKMKVADIDAAFDPKRDLTVNPVLWEIRRERRVELMGEGFRLNDLFRWKKGEYLNKTPKGVYLAKTDLEDVRHRNGAIDVKKFTFALDGGDKGRIVIYGTPENPNQGTPNPGWIDKYYLAPLPINDLLLNEKLEQNPGWPKTNADK